MVLLKCWTNICHHTIYMNKINQKDCKYCGPKIFTQNLSIKLDHAGVLMRLENFGGQIMKKLNIVISEIWFSASACVSSDRDIIKFLS